MKESTVDKLVRQIEKDKNFAGDHQRYKYLCKTNVSEELVKRHAKRLGIPIGKKSITVLCVMIGRRLLNHRLVTLPNVKDIKSVVTISRKKSLKLPNWAYLQLGTEWFQVYDLLTILTYEKKRLPLTIFKWIQEKVDERLVHVVWKLYGDLEDEYLKTFRTDSEISAYVKILLKNCPPAYKLTDCTSDLGFPVSELSYLRTPEYKSQSFPSWAITKINGHCCNLFDVMYLISKGFLSGEHVSLADRIKKEVQLVQRSIPQIQLERFQTYMSSVPRRVSDGQFYDKTGIEGIHC